MALPKCVLTIGPLNIDRLVLNTLEMGDLRPWISPFNAPYFHLPAGQEHYRLLRFLSDAFENELILDIGTFHGASALALGGNGKNTVLSFDILNQRPRSFPHANIHFRVEDFLGAPDAEVLLEKSSLILLDTAHDGVFERSFWHRLVRSKFKGILLLDDIHLNDAMQLFWAEIVRPKNDISDFGHVTGTGLVCFNPEWRVVCS